jgi:hypothetical protein
LPVPVRARPEPHPTTRSHSRRFALHRSAHFGNLRYPACWLRTPRKVGARSRPLTQDLIVARRSCRSGATSLLAPCSIRNARPSWARAHSARARGERFPAGSDNGALQLATTRRPASNTGKRHRARH